VKKLLLRWLINAVAIAAAVYLVPGIQVGAGPGLDPVTLLLVALIFGLINALVKPVLKAMSCAVVVLTLGLFIFVINTAMLFLTEFIAKQAGLVFEINGLVAGFIAAVLITIISLVLNVLVPDE
jgi:putative membrane protein